MIFVTKRYLNKMRLTNSINKNGKVWGPNSDLDLKWARGPIDIKTKTVTRTKWDIYKKYNTQIGYPMWS